MPMLDSAPTCDLSKTLQRDLESKVMKSGPADLTHLLSAVDSEMTLGSEKGDPTERQLSVKLEDKDLWQKFTEFTNEMIVTKTGRRMFPVFRVSISGLDPNSMYTLLLDFVQVDNHRWKYVNGEWVAGGKAEPAVPNCVYIHPDSPNFGAHWMKEPLNFSKVKLTNKLNGGGQIMLNSLHKYEPRLHIVKVDSRAQKKSLSTVTFPETRFIAVTAYQNEEITALKIKHNPFAKAFLDAKERPEQKDYIHETTDQQRFPHLAGTWYLPTGGNGIVPPPAHQYPTGLGLSNPGCERLNLKSARHSPYARPHHRRSPPQGNLPRDVTPSLPPMFNITDNWAHITPTVHGMLPCSTTTNSSQNQYTGMWNAMAGNLPANQNTSMSYVRASPQYSFTPTSSVSNISPVSLPSTESLYQFPCDMTNFSQNVHKQTWTTLSPTGL